MRQSGKNQKRTIAVLLTGLLLAQSQELLMGEVDLLILIQLPKTMGRAVDIIKTST